MSTALYVTFHDFLPSPFLNQFLVAYRWLQFMPYVCVQCQYFLRYIFCLLVMHHMLHDLQCSCKVLALKLDLRPYEL